MCAFVDPREGGKSGFRVAREGRGGSSRFRGSSYGAEMLEGWQIARRRGGRGLLGRKLLGEEGSWIEVTMQDQEGGGEARASRCRVVSSGDVVVVRCSWCFGVLVWCRCGCSC